MIQRLYTEDQRAPVITKILIVSHTCQYENMSLFIFIAV